MEIYSFWGTREENRIVSSEFLSCTDRDGICKLHLQDIATGAFTDRNLRRDVLDLTESLDSLGPEYHRSLNLEGGMFAQSHPSESVPVH